MRPLLFALVALVTETAAKCTANDCLRAVQKVATSLRNGDCESFVRITVTSDTSTIFNTTVVTTTGTETREATGAIATTPEPSKRWLQRHEVINILMGRAVGSTIQTATPATAQATSVPGYAAACVSPAAYVSACSCIGVTPTTVTEATLSTTQVKGVTVTTASMAASTVHPTASHGNGSTLLGNSTSARFSNITATFLNETASEVSPSPSLPLTRADSASIGDKYKLKDPIVMEQSSITEENITLATASGLGIPMGLSSMIVHSNATGTLLFSNATSSTILPLGHTNSTGSLNSTEDRTSNSTSSAVAPSAASSAPFLNSTITTLSNTTNAAKFVNSTVAAVAFTNVTSASVLNSTATPSLNTTSRAPFLNSTSSPVRISNATSTAPATATSTSTLDRTCGMTSAPFSVQVAQPGGMFDGWYLKTSGDAVIFTAAAGSSTRFSVGASGHLCAVGYAGAEGNAAIAIAENRTESAGSAVWFVDPAVLEAVDENGYAALRCSADGAALACEVEEEAGKRFWVGCGLGLDITSDGDGVAVVDGWNCTGVTLSTVYS